MSMATKDQERKALEQIQKIVTGLGEGSYIGMAFEGVYQMVNNNIDNDEGCSVQYYIDEYYTAQSKARENQSKIEWLEKSIESMEIEKKKDEELNKIWREDFKKQHETAEETIRIQNEKIANYEAQLKSQSMEIIQLKAKLYDLMQNN